jgi:tRNA(Ile2) C34 agmatinyltransferase TiaS
MKKKKNKRLIEYQKPKYRRFCKYCNRTTEVEDYKCKGCGLEII